ncbi:ABC-type multidrug transport system, permease component [Desulfocucumis palustris]|uniref:ABC-type multidrug transport system, permease component n=1 Tax=Desulfocucumis palustris TaxID=1898651 RepID=A0A2L2XHD8_9FIRM|nr:ABC transporter permease [Desulfocucumis palustris]GBF35625.1 ABC-type multidrug transport system, permease component [Desulfocucumis palustris]
MIKNIAYICKRELKYISGDKKLLFIIFAFPLLGLTLFNIMYGEHIVLHIKTAVWDQSNTSASRSVIRAFEDSDRFNVVAAADSEAQLKKMIESREVQAAVVIPPDFSREIKKGKSTKVLVIVNGTNMLYSNAVLSSANEIVGTISGGAAVAALEGKGLLPESAYHTAQPVEYALRIWYNPTFNYANFLILGLLATAVQQVTLLYIAVAIVREKTSGAVRELLDRGISPLELVAGKVLTYLAANLASLNMVLAICVFVFKIPFNGSILNLLILELLFIGAILAVGIFLSVVSKTELEATQYSMLVALPSFLFSGYTWPVDSMPGIIKAISAILPLTYFCSNLRDIALMNIGLGVMKGDILTLALMNAVFLPLGILLFRRQCR